MTKLRWPLGVTQLHLVLLLLNLSFLVIQHVQPKFSVTQLSFLATQLLVFLSLNLNFLYLKSIFLVTQLKFKSIELIIILIYFYSECSHIDKEN